MPRSPGQLPNKLGSDHTHLKSEIIDDETREPAEFGEGGGAIAVDNTVDDPVDVTGIVAPGATFDGTTVAVAARFYAQAADPGAVGAGAVWKDISGGVGDNAIWRERDLSNEWWAQKVTLNAIAADFDGATAGPHATTVDGDADASPTATTSGEGGAYASPHANANGTGSADARPRATAGVGNASAGPRAIVVDGFADAGGFASASGAGSADARPRATAAGAGDADAAPTALATNGDATVASTAVTTAGTAFAGSLAFRGAASAGMSAEVDGTSARLAFNGTTPIAIPEIPASPTEQDIADVLVALGLATQAA